jgi:hypothetical protein
MEKIKAVDPKIIVGGKADKPYYQIEYYDLSGNEWHIGYGSYCLANVKEWLKTCFEVTNADVAPVKHGHWNTGYFHDRVCSCCLHPDNDINDYAHSYCPNCGAKMDGGNDNDR